MAKIKLVKANKRIFVDESEVTTMEAKGYKKPDKTKVLKPMIKVKTKE